MDTRRTPVRPTSKVQARAVDTRPAFAASVALALAVSFSIFLSILILRGLP